MYFEQNRTQAYKDSIFRKICTSLVFGEKAAKIPTELFETMQGAFERYWGGVWEDAWSGWEIR